MKTAPFRKDTDRGLLIPGSTGRLPGPQAKPTMVAVAPSAPFGLGDVPVKMTVEDNGDGSFTHTIEPIEDGGR